jgi:hypothetical protein
VRFYIHLNEEELVALHKLLSDKEELELLKKLEPHLKVYKEKLKYGK